MKTLLRTALLIGVTATGIYTCSSSQVGGNDAPRHSTWQAVGSYANPNETNPKQNPRSKSERASRLSLKIQATAQVKKSAELMVSQNAPSIGATQNITVKPLCGNTLCGSTHGGASEAIRDLSSMTRHQSQQRVQEADSSKRLSLTLSPDSLVVSAPTPAVDKTVRFLPGNPCPDATTVAALVTPISASGLSASVPKPDPKVSFAKPAVKLPAVNAKQLPMKGNPSWVTSLPTDVPNVVDLAKVSHRLDRGEMLQKRWETDAVDPVADFPVAAERASRPVTAPMVPSSKTIQ